MSASRPKSRALRSASRTADRLRLADAPLGPTRAKKGRGRAASPTVGGSRGATFVALCPYVSSVVGADVGAARLWRLPADLFSGRPMAVTDFAPVPPLPYRTPPCGAPRGLEHENQPARERPTGQGCPALLGRAKGWVATCVTGTCSRPEGRSRSGGRCRRRCRSENASDVGAVDTGPHPVGC